MESICLYQMSKKETQNVQRLHRSIGQKGYLIYVCLGVGSNPGRHVGSDVLSS